MTGSMCVSMTGKPTFAQRQNEQRRQSYGYYQVAQREKLNPKKFAEYLEGKCNERRIREV